MLQGCLGCGGSWTAHNTVGGQNSHGQWNTPSGTQYYHVNGVSSVESVTAGQALGLLASNPAMGFVGDPTGLAQELQSLSSIVFRETLTCGTSCAAHAARVQIAMTVITLVGLGVESSFQAAAADGGRFQAGNTPPSKSELAYRDSTAVWQDSIAASIEALATGSSGSSRPGGPTNFYSNILSGPDARPNANPWWAYNGEATLQSTIDIVPPSATIMMIGRGSVEYMWRFWSFKYP